MKYENLGYSKNFENHPLSELIPKYVKYGPILDIGCGNGNLLKLFKNKFEVEGFDLSHIAINEAKKRNLKVRVSDIQNFKTNKKFKTIFMIGLLMLTKEPKNYLDITKTWLEDKGVIMLTIPNGNSLKNLFGFSKRRNKNHLYYPNYFEFRNFLEKNDFEILECSGTGRLEKFPILSLVTFYIIKPKNSKKDLISQNI